MSNRPYYTQALKALTDAHSACHQAWASDPKQNPVGMSHGPFSGVNKALGIVDALEQENRRLKALLAPRGSE